jgi:hypothetical protein
MRLDDEDLVPVASSAPTPPPVPPAAKTPAAPPLPAVAATQQPTAAPHNDPAAPQQRATEAPVGRATIERSGRFRRVEGTGPQRRVEGTGPQRRVEGTGPHRRVEGTGPHARTGFDPVDEEFFAREADLQRVEAVDYFEDLGSTPPPAAEDVPDLRSWLPFGSRTRKPRER